VSENVLRDAHDAVARSANPAQASLRPPGTTPRELRAMRRDVLHKLRLGPGVGVVEIGCGTALLGVPIAERAERYVGLDFAPEAVRVARERLAAVGIGGNARVLCLDVLSADDEQRMRALGCFERVLVYAVLQCVRNEQDGIRFLQRTLDLLAPGGRALVGSLPLEDLAVDWTPREPPPKGMLERLLVAGRWIGAPGAAPVPLTRRWKARRAIERIVKMRLESPLGDFTPTLIPARYTLSLSTSMIERWLSGIAGEFTYHWELPAPNVPLAAGRADLILLKQKRPVAAS
jgi:SAM-dependent methyltransferase